MVAAASSNPTMPRRLALLLAAAVAPAAAAVEPLAPAPLESPAADLARLVPGVRA